MTARKEGAGLRAPNSNSLREEMLRLFREDPRATLGRQELARGFGITIKAVDRTAAQLRKEGLIITVSGYRLVEAPGPAINHRKPKRTSRAKPKPPMKPHETPRVPNSVFDMAALVGVEE